MSADEAYGNGPLRAWLEREDIAYVLAVARDHRVPGGAGRTIRADTLAARVPPAGWQRISRGPGSKGDRVYDWGYADAAGGRRLLIRRAICCGELAFYLCNAPHGATMAELVRVAGARWAVEELPGRHERDRTGPLPGQAPRRLVSARDAGDVRACVAGRHRRCQPLPAEQPRGARRAR